ncbi:MAG: zinc ABC transporter substrate-binding protein [Chitinivibrionia bacterium]|nr:zinc ABC transporter substrate-binding protein [Chitinivibrionia bacterium]
MFRVFVIILLSLTLAFARGERRNRAATATAQPAPQEIRLAVAVSIPALGALSREILRGVPVDVLEPFGTDFTMDEFDGLASEYSDELDEIAPRVAAVVGIRSIIPDDPIFVQLRHRNIRVVEIDCAIPPSPTGSAIPLIRTSNGEINPFVWLSLANAVRMAEILESDFSALFPKYACVISANLLDFKRRSLALRNEYTRKLLEIDNFSAVALSGIFDYLLMDIDVFVVARFLPEYDWNEETARKFRDLVESGEVGVVINRWQTGAPASEIMEEKGVRTAVLRTGIPALSHFDDGFLAFWERNVSAIAGAFQIKE